MNKKVLLINAPNYDADDKRRLRPLGISYLASSLRSAGFECDILDPNCKSKIIPLEDILQEIHKNKYSVVGISAVTPNFHYAVKIAKKIKEEMESVVLLGGIHATFSHDKIINEYDCFDVIMRGEGERAIVELLQDFFYHNKFTYPISGCTYLNLDGKKYYAEDINALDTIRDLPFPAEDNCMEYSETLIDGRLLKNISVITSRGCPYDCIFCSVTSLRRKWITRTPNDIATEIFSFYKKNKNIFIVFSDDNFYIDRERACKIIATIKNVCGESIPFCFATRTDLIVRHGMETLLYLKENGCYSIELGIENGDNNVLCRMGKRNNVENNIKAISMLQSIDIKIGVDFILFDPWTTLNEIKNNIKFLKKTGLWGYYPTLIYIRMIPYPGTRLSCIMDMEYDTRENITQYFHDNKVEILFDLIMKFRIKYQKIIDEMIDEIRDTKRIRDILMLKLLPYLFLEKAIVESEQLCPSFDKISLELKIDEILNRIKGI